MKPCNDIREQIPFYLDDELRDDELRTFEAHVASCRSCADAVDEERAFLDHLRENGQFADAPDRLRDEVQLLLAGESGAERAPAYLRRRVERLVSAPSPVHVGRKVLAIAAALSLLLVMVTLTLRTGRIEIVGPSEFAEMAVATHQRHLRGGLPLEVESESADAITTWFANKVPFRLEIPTYQEVSGQDRLYGLRGARLVGYRGDYAAFVAYEMASRPISLIVTSTALAVPSGGYTVVSKGLTFHFDTVDGLKVITWSHRGLTYALVSDLEERGEASCAVCHQDPDNPENLAILSKFSRDRTPTRLR